jgi:hypothetical protein
LIVVDVHEIGSNCVGGAELAVHKGKLQALSDETHAVLKKNVFQHYEQFIDTAKDISCNIPVARKLCSKERLTWFLINAYHLGRSGWGNVPNLADVEGSEKSCSEPVGHFHRGKKASGAGC